VSKVASRIPENYNGTQPTSHHVGVLLAAALAKLNGKCQERPDLLLEAWPEVIGPKQASMTQAVSFCDGILTVKVKNSTLHSLLSRHDKGRILTAIRQRFPKANIQNIVFRIA
jgi:Dna[CI] antecedent, DciA